MKAKERKSEDVKVRWRRSDTTIASLPSSLYMYGAHFRLMIIIAINMESAAKIVLFVKCIFC